jgi:hypothetical protein
MKVNLRMKMRFYKKSTLERKKKDIKSDLISHTYLHQCFDIHKIVDDTVSTSTSDFNFVICDLINNKVILNELKVKFEFFQLFYSPINLEK